MARNFPRIAEGVERADAAGVAGAAQANAGSAKLRGPRTLWARIFWLIMPIVSSLLVLHGIAILSQNEELVTGEFEAQGRVMAKNLAFLSELGVGLADTERLEEAMQGASAIPDVAYIYIYSEAGTMLAKGGRQVAESEGFDGPLSQEIQDKIALNPEPISLETTNGGQDFFEFFAPVYSEKEALRSPDEELFPSLYAGRGESPGATKGDTKRVIGFVRLILSPQRAESQILTFLQQWVLATAFALVLCTFAISFFSRRLTRPVTRLTEQARMISEGVLDQEIPVASRDEIGQLARTFNQMGAALKANVDEKERVLWELQNLNRTLEDRVTERTAELEERTLELQHTLGEVRALGKISRAVSSTLDVDAVFANIVGGAVELSDSDGGVIYEFDQAVQQFYVRASHRIRQDFIDELNADPIGLGEGALGTATARREPVEISDVRNEGDALSQRIRPILAKAGYRSLLVVPLLVQERIVGGLVVLRYEAGRFPANVIGVLQTVADQSVIAFRNAQLFRQIADKNQQLEIVSEHKSQFLANMSHELRTPLNAILGYTELILDDIYGEVPEEIREVMERVEHNGQHLLGLINDVLDLSKIEAGQLSLSFTDYSMKEVVQAVIASVEPMAAEKNLVLKTTLPDGLPTGRGDDRRIVQVAMNLVGNAIKFTEAGEVALRVSAGDGVFLFSVSDTGPGISETDQKNIFEEFHQVDSTSTREKGGTGLGLAICRHLVNLHGGHIWMESTPGKGSTFWFMLPVRAN